MSKRKVVQLQKQLFNAQQTLETHTRTFERAKAKHDVAERAVKRLKVAVEEEESKIELAERITAWKALVESKENWDEFYQHYASMTFAQYRQVPLPQERMAEYDEYMRLSSDDLKSVIEFALQNNYKPNSLPSTRMDEVDKTKFELVWSDAYRTNASEFEETSLRALQQRIFHCPTGQIGIGKDREYRLRLTRSYYFSTKDNLGNLSSFQQQKPK